MSRISNAEKARRVEEYEQSLKSAPRPMQAGSAVFPFLSKDGWVVRRVKWLGSNISGFEDSEPMEKWQVIDTISNITERGMGL